MLLPWRPRATSHELCAYGNKSWISASSSWSQSTSTERENSYVQRGKVQRGEAYLGEEQNGDKPGCGSENKVSIVAAASLDEAGQPIHVKVAKVETLSFAAIAYWAQDALAHCTARPKRYLRGGGAWHLIKWREVKRKQTTETRKIKRRIVRNHASLRLSQPLEPNNYP